MHNTIAYQFGYLTRDQFTEVKDRIEGKRTNFMVQATSEDDADTVRSPYAWQPIETAPKNVTVVLLYRYRRGSLSWSICYWDADKCGWVKYDNPDSWFEEPTHWMPLPSPPQQDGDHTDAAAGFEEGAMCKRGGCAGMLFYDRAQNCNCHISPPCHACVDNPLTCTDCGWVEDIHAPPQQGGDRTV